MSTNVFLSCSFAPEDKPINSLVMALCKGLDIDCVNVATASTQLPPEKAREYITSALALVAVISRRNKINESDYMMPASVRDEIGIAYGLKKPLLLIVEEAVLVDGFMPHFGTFLRYATGAQHDDSFIEKLTASLYNLKNSITPPTELPVDPQRDEFISESTMILTVLSLSDSDDILWTQSTTKTLRFKKTCRSPLMAACWSSQATSVPDSASPIEMDLIVHQGSRNFTLRKTVLKETATENQATFDIDPLPSENDVLSYTTRYRSKYLCPLYMEDIKHPMPLTLEGKPYVCFDGIVPIQPTKRLKSQYRFPREYGLTGNDLHFFVGSYTMVINYIVDSEISRARSTVDSFGGDVVFTIEVDSPLLRHMYGITWNPPYRQNPGGKPLAVA